MTLLFRYKFLLSLCLIIWQIVVQINGLPGVIKIGGIFESGETELIDAFKAAVDRVNNDRTVLSRKQLMARVETIKPHDSFHAAKLICNNLVNDGVWALLGSESPAVGWLLRSLANNLHIPHLSVFWDYRTYRQWPAVHSSSSSVAGSGGGGQSYHHGSTTAASIAGNGANFTISLYPEASVLSQAFMDLVLSRNWKSFTLIFEQNDGLIKLKDLLRITSHPNMRRVKMSILQFDPNYPYDPKFQYQKLIKDVHKTEHNIVLSVSNDKVIELLRQAAQMKRLSEYDNYLITSLDIHTLNLSEFQYIQTNITGLTLLDPRGQEIGYAQRDWITGKVHSAVKKVVPTTTALIYDSVTLFAKAVDDFERSQQQSISSSMQSMPTVPMVGCESRDPWPYGTSLINFMKASNVVGLSGPLKLDRNGQRSDFTLDVLELKKTGFEVMAKWTKQDGIKSTTNYTSVLQEVLEIMKTKVLRVTVPIQKPYVFLKENHDQLEGNDRFEGFCVDLLQEIASVFETVFKSRFQYVYQIIPKNNYGRPNKDGEWNGMIGDLLRHQADLAIADLTATYDRERVVDFTMPFMNLGISILFKKPGLPEPELFSFLKPFSVEVWLYLASAYLGISLLLWILSRISPYEWVPGHPCDPEPEELENQFSIGNSLWFTIGSLMQQGSDLAPRALSTRTLASIWWFFTLIMISSYTANLAASLTLSRMAPAISNIEDLAKQTVIQYGCRKDGSTYMFFKNSNHSTYQRMFNTMESNPEVYIRETSQAIDRVKKGGYAYLMESSSLEYEVQRDCELIQIGSWLDNKGYGIATPPDSPYRTPLSNAIVVLQDKGMLYELKQKWWVKLGGGKCSDEPKLSSSAAELNIENVGGVFVVLVTGVGIGCVFAALEFIWKTMKVARHERESICKLIWLEIVRIFTGGGSSRPVPNAAGSGNTNTNQSLDSDSVPENESMADINNKLLVRMASNISNNNNTNSNNLNNNYTVNNNTNTNNVGNNINNINHRITPIMY
ncbi:glutamate receptor ionotropic, kainate 2-like [Oppia nitens]|uniref:glutamate receptor ionotropic, kainate 2-like n=1 Tax=Oppia nitens TaxID=1686743 RepID=UPI0023DBB520|nr:glutamate receptor ionotropic, kainate 2-like [Oppia nitens]